MGIGYAVGNVILAAQEYENWAEVITAIVKKQEPSKLILKNGLKIEAEVGLRFLVREIFFGRVYNPANLSIGENDVVVDIGANNGVFSLYAASTTRNKVYAFEPTPRNFEVLKRNIAVNGLKHVIANSSAVSDKVGSTRLFLNPLDGQQNLLSDYILPDKIEKYKASTDLDYLKPSTDNAEAFIDVPTTTLQAIMDSNHIERIDFLKLDCEGAEGPILHSTPKDYLQRIGKIAMEFHDHLSHFDHNDLQKMLEEAGFTTKLHWDNKSPLGYLYAWRN